MGEGTHRIAKKFHTHHVLSLSAASRYLRQYRVQTCNILRKKEVSTTIGVSILLQTGSARLDRIAAHKSAAISNAVRFRRRFRRLAKTAPNLTHVLTRLSWNTSTPTRLHEPLLCDLQRGHEARYFSDITYTDSTRQVLR